MIEYVIKETGEVIKRAITDTPISLTPEIEKAFQANASFRSGSLVDFAELGEPFFGHAGLVLASIKPNSLWWSVRIKTLNLHTAFKTEKEVTTPDFSNFADKRNVNQIPWRPPEDMTLVLGVHMDKSGYGYKFGKHYLMAYDSAKHTYRLPLSNLYDHCELCHGQYQGYHATGLKALMVGLQQFRVSLWNKDLYSLFQETNAPLMFRFKPVNTGFEQLPIEKGWVSLCQKVNNEIINSKFQPI